MQNNISQVSFSSNTAMSNNNLDQVEKLKTFLHTAPQEWNPKDVIKRYVLGNGEQISCVCWENRFYITGTDIVKILQFRFHAISRPIVNSKKFEEGIFSDLRNLKSGVDAALEEPRSKFLDFLYRHGCIRTQKKQKVFYWFHVPHDRLFMDALERDLKRESSVINVNSFLHKGLMGSFTNTNAQVIGTVPTTPTLHSLQSMTPMIPTSTLSFISSPLMNHASIPVQQSYHSSSAPMSFISTPMFSNAIISSNSTSSHQLVPAPDTVNEITNRHTKIIHQISTLSDTKTSLKMNNTINNNTLSISDTMQSRTASLSHELGQSSWDSYLDSTLLGLDDTNDSALLSDITSVSFDLGSTTIDPSSILSVTANSLHEFETIMNDEGNQSLDKEKDILLFDSMIVTTKDMDSNNYYDAFYQDQFDAKDDVMNSTGIYSIPNNGNTILQ